MINKLGMKLAGRNILLGVTGGIAAYKCAELVRLLKKSGAEVQVVMTLAAESFITPLTLQTLSGRTVRTQLFDIEQESTMGHIDLARWADIVMIAPATANFLSQLAKGNAPDLLTTLCLATEAPVIVAPAMNRVMWTNSATVENAAILKANGIHLWGPDSGEQACGETGEGRMMEPAYLHSRLIGLLTSGPLQGMKVIVTAGPTHEPIDPVRYIGNRSSGKMGFSLAQAFVHAGAEVILISGPVILDTPSGLQRKNVETASEMFDAVMESVADSDIFVACAAVADFQVAQTSEQKIKKTSDPLTLELLPNKDILTYVAKLDNAPFTLGFAAETQNLIEYANDKRLRKGIDVIAANLVGEQEGGFNDDKNSLTVLWDSQDDNSYQQVELPMMDKKVLAKELVRLVIKIYHSYHTKVCIEKTIEPH